MTATPGRVVHLGLVLGAASLPALCFPDAIGRASAMWLLAEGARPYWVPAEALLLYGIVPLVVLSAIVLFLAPGMLLALTTGRGRSTPVWLLSAVPFSLGAAFLVAEVARAFLTARASGWLMFGALGLSTVTAFLFSRRRELPWPGATLRDWFPVGSAVIGMLLLYLMLVPKLLWESFNGDGAHAFAISRLLLNSPWPFFPESAGPVAAFPGTTSMLFAFPNAWFIQLFGPLESAIRLPFLLYTPLVVLGVQALAEEGDRPLATRTQLAIWAGVLPFVLAMAFSASYSPYHADIALPGVQDTLLVVCVLGFLHAMVRREWAWAAGFGLLSYISLPNGLLLMGFWLLAELVVMRPRPWSVAARGALLLVACMVAAASFAVVLHWTGQTPPGGEYGLARTIADVLRIDLTQWRRVVYLLVGGAVFPVGTLLLWRKQDQVSRRVTLMVLAYFLFFFVQTRFSLHHLVPAMILPLVVAARLRPIEQPASTRYHLAWLMAALVAAVLSLPSSFAITTAERRVGMTVTQQVGSYDASDPAVFEASSLLGEAFPADWDADVPATAYGGSALTWLYYADEGAVTPHTAYLLSRRDAMTDEPTAAAPFAVDSAFRLDILNAPAYAAHQALRPATDTHAPIYVVPRASLFGLGGPHTIDLARLLDRVARRIGVRGQVEEQP